MCVTLLRPLPVWLCVYVGNYTEPEPKLPKVASYTIKMKTDWRWTLTSRIVYISHKKRKKTILPLIKSTDHNQIGWFVSRMGEKFSVVAEVPFCKKLFPTLFLSWIACIESWICFQLLRSKSCRCSFHSFALNTFTSFSLPFVCNVFFKSVTSQPISRV